MCSPEDDLPRNVLLSEFTEDEIENISEKASKLFCDNLEKLISDPEFYQSDLKEDLQDIVLLIRDDQWDKVRKLLVKRLEDLYALIFDVSKLASWSKGPDGFHKFYQQATTLSGQIDLCLLKVLFDYTKIDELLGRIPMDLDSILNFYGKSCEVAMKLVDSNQQKKLEKCRDFFFDSVKWVQTKGSEWPSKMKKKYPNLEYEVNCVKKLIKRKKGVRY